MPYQTNRYVEFSALHIMKRIVNVIHWLFLIVYKIVQKSNSIALAGVSLDQTFGHTTMVCTNKGCKRISSPFKTSNLLRKG